MKCVLWILVLIAVVLIVGSAVFVRYPSDGRVDIDKTRPPLKEGFYFDRFEIAQVYFQRSSWISNHTIPYKDVLEEYPQAGVLYFSFPRLFTDNRDVFMYVIVAMNVALWVVTVVLSSLLLKELSLSRWRILALLLPSFVYFTIARYDIFPVALVVASLAALQKKYLRLGIIFLTLAIFAKWYAVLLVPFYFAYATSNGFLEKIRKQALVIGGSIFVSIMGITFAFAGLSTLYPYGVHIGRSVEIGSLYTVVIETLFSIIPKSFDSSVLSAVSPVLFLIQFSGLIFGIVVYRRMSKSVFSFEMLLRWSVLAIGVFVLVGKFYSGQWELWWFVLAMLVVRGKWEWTLLLACDVLNYVQVPLLYKTIGPYSFFSDAIVVIRSLVLIILLAKLAKPLVQLVKGWKSNVIKRPSSVSEF